MISGQLYATEIKIQTDRKYKKLHRNWEKSSITEFKNTLWDQKPSIRKNQTS